VSPTIYKSKIAAMNGVKLFLLQLLCVCNIALFAQTSMPFTIANPLQTNMVVQQSKPTKVWGTANAEDIISVKADWMKNVVTIKANKNNEWSGNINVPEATTGDFTSHTITFIHRKDTIHLINILIGE